VTEAQRGNGIGRMLVASAAITGLQFGKSKVTLAAQDNGAGRLTEWYKGMGFTQVGVNQRGHPKLEAPIGRVLAGTAQRKAVWRGAGTLQAMESVTLPSQDDPAVEALSKLAIPRTFRLPDKALNKQNNVVAEIENSIKKSKFVVMSAGVDASKTAPVFCLGGVELSTEKGRFSSKIAGTLKQITPSNIPDGYPAIKDNKPLKKNIVYFVMKTLEESGQLEYLKISTLIDSDEWKVVVEIHYYRNRDVTGSPGFHKDTLGQTMFVNLSFVKPVKMAGPEYILNPPEEEHRKRLEGSLAPAHLRHVSAVRDKLPTATDIVATEISEKANVIAFGEGFIYHKSPLYGHRTVTGADLRNFLTTVPSLEFKMIYDNARFVADTDDIDREKLKPLGLSDGQIDKLMYQYSTVEYKRAFQEVSIPDPLKPGTPVKAPVPELRRQASYQKLLTAPPKEIPRRFFRMWVRAVPRKDPL
jgi:hypothetical protein